MLNEKQLRDLIINQQKSFSQIAKIYKINVGVVSRHSKKYGITSRHISKIEEKPLPINEIYKEYIAGSSLDFLRKKYCRPVAAIKRQLLKVYPDIAFRTMNDAKRPAVLNDVGLLTDALNEHGSVTKLSKYLGVKIATVSAALKRFNVKGKDCVVLPFNEVSDLYINKKWSTPKLAEKYGVSVTKIINFLNANSIPVRGFGGARVSSHAELEDSEFLHKMYIDDEWSMAKMAETIGTSLGNIAHFLKKHGIPLRSREQVYDKLDGHGEKVVYKSERHGIFRCDSLLELKFLKCKETASSIIKPDRLDFNGIYYYPDFSVDGGFYEVKSKRDSEIPGESRVRCVKQFLVAKKCGVDVTVWNGEDYSLKIEDIDKYYCQDWRLCFDDFNDCFMFLKSFGFHGFKLAIPLLYNTVADLRLSLDDVRNGLNANKQAASVMDLIKHFSQHYYHSHHDGYLPVSAAWELGNHSVLNNALKRLWDESYTKNSNHSRLNIKGLIARINKDYKDFSGVSIFKPWVARHIYKSLVGSSGTIVDPCMGWGGRLLGCFESMYEYKGSDLNSNVIAAHGQLFDFVKNSISKAQFSQSDATSDVLPDGDLLFTSPPYDTTEYYYGLKPSININEIFNNIFGNFKGIIALNIPHRSVSDCMKIARKHNRIHSDTVLMNTASFMGREKTTEPILVFKAR